MEATLFLLDFIVNIDKHLLAFIAQHGSWVYVLLFLIVFVETGVVFMPFLPGDSLLFVVGAIATQSSLDYVSVMAILLAAAFTGDQCNYLIGRYLGKRILGLGYGWWFKRRHFDAAQHFYQRHGPIAIVLARFFPFLRTFAPFVAGGVCMSYPLFTFYNFLGGMIWVAGVVTAGYLFGNLAWIRENLKWIIWGIIVIPGILVIGKAWFSDKHSNAKAYDTKNI